MKVQIYQIEKSDIAGLRRLMQSGFRPFLDDFVAFKQLNIDKWEEELKHDDYYFCIRGEAIGAGKNYLVGLCGVTDVDWFNRHGRLDFFMVDKDGVSGSIQPHEDTRDAMRQLLEFAFSYINLNKVWLSVFDNDPANESLISLGFTKEGVMREEMFNRVHIDTCVYSILASEYREIYDRGSDTSEDPL